MAKVVYLDPGFSDHVPLLVDSSPIVVHKVAKPFHFLNYWTLDNEIHNISGNSWLVSINDLPSISLCSGGSSQPFSSSWSKIKYEDIDRSLMIYEAN